MIVSLIRGSVFLIGPKRSALQDMLRNLENNEENAPTIQASSGSQRGGASVPEIDETGQAHIQHTVEPLLWGHYCIQEMHRHTHSPQTYVQRLWLIVLVNLRYSFNDHAWLPPCVAMSRHCEEPGCSFQTLERRSLIGYYMALFNALTYKFS